MHNLHKSLFLHNWTARATTRALVRILKMEKIFIPRWINNIIFWKMYGKNETTFCLAKKSQVKGGKQLLTRTLRTTTTTINLIMSNTCCAFSFLFFNAFKVCYYLHTGCIPFSYLIKKIMIFFYIHSYFYSCLSQFLIQPTVQLLQLHSSHCICIYFWARILNFNCDIFKRYIIRVTIPIFSSYSLGWPYKMKLDLSLPN